eukprot:CAMPEP_0116065118 /NCGR_PEP_ID=MMETSP0322-20121206/9537_1 /TAXON_ID=163516 /ORGANISM="Leptocylindrus danicus var. apora, Strain B651" /LENGTH=593 /DNA_ID=CAMNT_0003551301 /DNA_START=713 /DNA_END=2492 /DNA_ORIENTATION=-
MGDRRRQQHPQQQQQIPMRYSTGGPYLSGGADGGGGVSSTTVDPANNGYVPHHPQMYQHPHHQAHPSYSGQPPVPPVFALKEQPPVPPIHALKQPPSSSSSVQLRHHNVAATMRRQRPQHLRPAVKLSVSLIDTYRKINRVYYEERANNTQQHQSQNRHVSSNRRHHPSSREGGEAVFTIMDGNYDYIIDTQSGELLNDRYEIKSRIGKGSFGQVVRAIDRETNGDVAIKIIKSKKPFLLQAKTEIELLSRICDKDCNDEHNIVRLKSHFMYRNHQCLVFEMLSLNLYEFLKNTDFSGVSLNLLRKFAKQILKALSYLATPEVDIIHCDLKPENILLCTPKRSAIKVIDFGSSCRSNKPMYSYIQSRFYRSPEVMLGLPYSTAIDIWSLGCILVEMHTGEPLFSGSDQVDQMQKIVKILGMPPTRILEQATDANRSQFFERGSNGHWKLKGISEPLDFHGSKCRETLTQVINAETSKKKKHPQSEAHSQQLYDQFIDLIQKMFIYDASLRITPDEALHHPFIISNSNTVATHGKRGPNDTSSGNFISHGERERLEAAECRMVGTSYSSIQNENNMSAGDDASVRSRRAAKSSR